MPPTPPEDDLHAAMALAEALRPVLHRLHRQLRRESHDLGVSPLQALLLVAILEHPGIGVVELARLENLRGPTISGHIKTMQSLGLVERAAPNAEDRRRVGLLATSKARDLIDAIRRSRTDWLAQQLAALAPNARLAIRGALGPLSEIAQ